MCSDRKNGAVVCHFGYYEFYLCVVDKSNNEFQLRIQLADEGGGRKGDDIEE
jgi:hypothetical protein